MTQTRKGGVTVREVEPCGRMARGGLVKKWLKWRGSEGGKGVVEV